LNLSNDLKRINDLNKKWSTWKDLQLCSWLNLHLVSFKTMELCFKINDLEIHIFLIFKIYTDGILKITASANIYTGNS